MGGETRMVTPNALVGRDRELETIDAVGCHGGALLWCGPPGAGRSALLDAAARRASAAGVRVVRAAGAAIEADLAYAGLHQVVWPLRDGVARLGDLHRVALSTALGLDRGPPADRLVVATATLTLLTAAAPLLVLVDDLHRCDRPSAAVLGLVGRRLGGARVALVAAADPATDLGIPVLELDPLPDIAAGALLPACHPAVARRLLAQARGNPLALVELPAALTAAQLAGDDDLPDPPPLTPRLAAAFGAGLDDLPAPVRRLLLLAALDGPDDAGACRRAGDLADLAPAERAGWSPWTRATVRSFVTRWSAPRSSRVSTDGERCAAHRALAEC